MREDLLREKFGRLHERLDCLEQVTTEAPPQVTDTVGVVRDIVLTLEADLRRGTAADRLVSAETLQRRLALWSTALCRDWGIRPHFYSRAEGNTSVALVEKSLPVLLAALRYQMRGLAGEDSLVRYEQGLFPSTTLGIELSCNDRRLRLRCQSDCLYLQTNPESREQLCAQVADLGGWLHERVLQPQGAELVIELPVPASRVSAVLLKAGNAVLALPATCLAPAAASVDNKAKVMELSAEHGLVPSERALTSYLPRFRIGDLECAVYSDGPAHQQQVALHSDCEWIQPGSWHSHVAVTPSAGAAGLYPYLDGKDFYQLLRRRLYGENQ